MTVHSVGRVLGAFALAVGFLGYSAKRFRRGRTASSVLQLIGAACVVVVVLTHVAETLHAIPSMRWGQPDSVGHYLDLTSAIGAVSCLLAASLLWLRDQGGRGNRERSR
jgi:hypothetical protein